jgi:hypothetical protein
VLLIWLKTFHHIFDSAYHADPFVELYEIIRRASRGCCRHA